METNIEILVKILSAGVITSFVTGIFSLIISLRNNKKLIELEKIKHKHELDSKRYDFLYEYMLLLSEKYKEFEPDKIDDTRECSEQIFTLLLDQFSFIKEEHEKHSYLFDKDENTDINKNIGKINGYIDEFIADAKFRNAEHFVENVHNVAFSIKEFADTYIENVRNKINKILNGN